MTIVCTFILLLNCDIINYKLCENVYNLYDHCLRAVLHTLICVQAPIAEYFDFQANIFARIVKGIQT